MPWLKSSFSMVNNFTANSLTNQNLFYEKPFPNMPYLKTNFSMESCFPTNSLTNTGFFYGKRFPVKFSNQPKSFLWKAVSQICPTLNLVFLRKTIFRQVLKWIQIFSMKNDFLESPPLKSGFSIENQFKIFPCTNLSMN